MIKRTLHRILGYEVNIYCTMPTPKIVASKRVRCWLGEDCVVRAWWEDGYQVSLMSDGSVAGLPAEWDATWERAEIVKSENWITKQLSIVGRKVCCGLHLIWFFFLLLLFAVIKALDNPPLPWMKNNQSKSQCRDNNFKHDKRKNIYTI